MSQRVGAKRRPMINSATCAESALIESRRRFAWPGYGSAFYSPAPQLRAVRRIQSRYSASGVTPVRPPQPLVLLGPVDQLTTPTITARPDCISNAGAPESPVQAPKP